jgi:N-acetylmuramoyl-L-alanine amidase
VGQGVLVTPRREEEGWGMAKMGFSRAWTLVAATLFALLLAAAVLISNEDAQATTSPVYGTRIVIDPGHGGTDAGARFDGSK